MSTTITIRDQSMSGETLNEMAIEITHERMTVRELIRSRVYQEVKEFNARAASVPQPITFHGLIQPTDVEVALNGDRATRRKQNIDWRRQFDRALEAFRANQILVLVDEQQASTLDDTVTLTASTNVSFLRLTMLVGG